LRRFDDILHYELPDATRIATLLKSRLGRMAEKGISWQRLADEAAGLSYAEIVRACDEALKEALMEKRQKLKESDIRRAIEERLQVAARFQSG